MVGGGIIAGREDETRFPKETWFLTLAVARRFQLGPHESRTQLLQGDLDHAAGFEGDVACRRGRDGFPGPERSLSVEAASGPAAERSAGRSDHPGILPMPPF
jgi:hypothetical protein